MQTRVAVEADGGEVRIFVDIDWILHSAADEKARRGAPAERRPQPRIDDRPVFRLNLGELAPPVIEAEAADQLKTALVAEPVDRVELVQDSRIDRGALGRCAAEEIRAAVANRAAIQLPVVGRHPAARLAVLDPARADARARTGLRDAGVGAFNPSEALVMRVRRPLGGCLAGARKAGERVQSDQGALHDRMCSTSAWPNPEHDT